MSKLRLTISMSLDGFVAGPNQTVENPLGIGGMPLHRWGNVVVLDPKVAQVFPNDDAVNAALRGLMSVAHISVPCCTE